LFVLELVKVQHFHCCPILHFFEWLRRRLLKGYGDGY
jgi:hypothetical protein